MFQAKGFLTTVYHAYQSKHPSLIFVPFLFLQVSGGLGGPGSDIDAPFFTSFYVTQVSEPMELNSPKDLQTRDMESKGLAKNPPWCA